MQVVLFSSPGRFPEIAGFIEIRNLSFKSIIGIYAGERTQPQTLIIDLCMGVDVQKQAPRDLSLCLDYSQIGPLLKDLIIRNEFLLLEDLAETASLFLYKTYPALLTLEFRVQKPEALAGQGIPAYLRLSERTDFKL